MSINYADLPPDAQVQLLEQIDIQADPNIIVAEKMQKQKAEADANKEKSEVMRMKMEARPKVK